MRAIEGHTRCRKRGRGVGRFLFLTSQPQGAPRVEAIERTERKEIERDREEVRPHPNIHHEKEMAGEADAEGNDCRDHDDDGLRNNATPGDKREVAFAAAISLHQHQALATENVKVERLRRQAPAERKDEVPKFVGDNQGERCERNHEGLGPRQSFPKEPNENWPRQQ